MFHAPSRPWLKDFFTTEDIKGRRVLRTFRNRYFCCGENVTFTVFIS